MTANISAKFFVNLAKIAEQFNLLYMKFFEREMLKTNVRLK